MVKFNTFISCISNLGITRIMKLMFVCLVLDFIQENHYHFNNQDQKQQNMYHFLYYSQSCLNFKNQKFTFFKLLQSFLTKINLKIFSDIILIFVLIHVINYVLFFLKIKMSMVDSNSRPFQKILYLSFKEKMKDSLYQIFFKLLCINFFLSNFRCIFYWYLNVLSN